MNDSDYIYGVFKWMMLWYLTLGILLKKKKSSSAEYLLVIFEAGFLLHFYLNCLP